MVIKAPKNSDYSVEKLIPAREMNEKEHTFFDSPTIKASKGTMMSNRGRLVLVYDDDVIPMGSQFIRTKKDSRGCARHLFLIDEQFLEYIASWKEWRVKEKSD